MKYSWRVELGQSQQLLKETYREILLDFGDLRPYGDPRTPNREVNQSNRQNPEGARDQNQRGIQDNGTISRTRSVVVVSNPKSTNGFEVFCFLMEGCGRPVSVDSVAECRLAFSRYPPETQRRIVDDATIRSQGKWRESEFTPDPINYLNSRIWDKAPITARKFAPVAKQSVSTNATMLSAA